MTIEELDTDHLRAHITNIFIQIEKSIMFKDLTNVKHFMSDGVYNSLMANLDKLNKSHPLQRFYEIGVVRKDFLRVIDQGDVWLLELNLVSGYGKATSAKESAYHVIKNYFMIFERKKEIKELPKARHCPSCGANVDVNKNGTCDYCGTTYNLKDMDWVLIHFETKR